MKFVINLLSSLVMGVALASSGFSPLHEIRHLLRNKNKIFTAIGLMAVGFVLGMAGLLIGLIEGALQLDAQGFLMWSALFSLSLLLMVFSGLTFYIARVVNPMRTMATDVNHNFLADLDSQFNLSQILQQWSDSRRASAERPRESESSREAPVDSRFSSVDPQSSFREMGREEFRH